LVGIDRFQDDFVISENGFVAQCCGSRTFFALYQGRPVGSGRTKVITVSNCACRGDGMMLSDQIDVCGLDAPATGRLGRHRGVVLVSRTLAGRLRVTAAAISFPAAWSALSRRSLGDRKALSPGIDPHPELVSVYYNASSTPMLVSRSRFRDTNFPGQSRNPFFRKAFHLRNSNGR
jgi:hypothetical protein